MTSPVASNGSVSSSGHEEWVVSMSNGAVLKIERGDPLTHARKEVSAEEYAALTAAYYAMYYASYYTGIRDHAQALASGDTDLAQAYQQGMTEFFQTLSQI